MINNNTFVVSWGNLLVSVSAAAAIASEQSGQRETIPL